ncbi:MULTISPECIES: hypothetical protein [Salinibaculum]|uniref:hypothetical protein n=1 Tax=Salinibaculum TaxID=2732368 RepID=UPI0030D5DA7D
MKRRQALQYLAGGGTVLLAGCSSFSEDPGPFTFAIVNFRERQYHAEFAIRDDDDELIRDGFVDIAPSPPGDGEFSALSFDNLPPVTNGETIDVAVDIDGKTFEETYEITCNQSENAENNFFFRIRHPGAANTDTESGMGFFGSRC